MEDLMSIPGIGHYTAGAVRNFAFNIPTPCIDTNIRRILHRTFVGPENADGTWKKDDQYLLEIAGEVLAEAIGQAGDQGGQGDRRRRRANTLAPSVSSAPSDWHAALMDFGSLVQTKSNPKWDICPLTISGIMMTTPKQWDAHILETKNQKPRTNNPTEPGRYVGSTFIPNRIFRGKIVEALRDAPDGMTFETLGKEVNIDWTEELKPWLEKLINKLVQDAMLARKGDQLVLRD